MNRLLQEGQVDEAIETAARLTAVANASSTYADGVAGGLVFKIVEADLAKAAEWVLRDHTSPLAKTSAFVVSSKMTSDDPVAAANWIQQLPVGRTRDLALHGMITKLSAVDPEAASQWLSLYSSPDVRQRTVPAIFTVWNSIDSVAAGEWVRNLKDVDEKWKAKFMRQSQ